MTNINKRQIKKIILIFTFFIFGFNLAQAYPSRCSYPRTAAGSQQFYNAARNWINSESSSATASYLMIRDDEALAAANSANTCGVHGNTHDISSYNALWAHSASCSKRAVFLNRGSVSYVDGSGWVNVSGCTSRSVTQTGIGGDWGVKFYITCGNTVYEAYVGCLNDQFWVKFAYNLCTPYTPTCSGAYPYTTQAAARYDGSCYYNTSQTTLVGSCGGSNTTCWRRNSRIPVQGYCPSWTYPYYSSANYDGSCYYNVSSTSGTGASCGGSNPTCYVRGSRIPVHATCGGQFPYNTYASANYDGTCYYNVFTTTYYGRCGGSNTTCYARGSRIPVNGVCGTVNNVKFLHTASSYSGYTICSSGTASPNPSFPALGSTVNWTCAGRCGGTSQACTTCRNRFPLRNQTSCPTTPAPYTKTNCPNPEAVSCDRKLIDYSNLCLDYQYACYRPKTCTEINGAGFITGTTSELTNDKLGDYTVFKNMAIKVGYRDGNNRACYKKVSCSEGRDTTPIGSDIAKANAALHECGENVFEAYVSPTTYTGSYPRGDVACGQCIVAANPWWQVSVGNIYASGEIDSQISDKCIGNSSCNQYLITKSANTCENTGGGNPGIPISNSSLNTAVKVPGSYFTQRGDAKKATYAAPSIVTNNQFSDFTNLLNYANIKNCPSNWLNGDLYLDTNICKLNAQTTTPTLSVPANKKVVIFVHGNLTITNKITVPTSSFLAFIVDGDITIAPNVGDTPTAANICSNVGVAQVQGIYIAKNITIEQSSNDRVPVQNFNCDKKFIGAGSFIASGQIELERTFKGCGANMTPYVNYNATHPAETFIFRPDLILNMPEWMKQPKKMRLETI